MNIFSEIITHQLLRKKRFSDFLIKFTFFYQKSVVNTWNPKKVLSTECTLYSMSCRIIDCEDKSGLNSSAESWDTYNVLGFFYRSVRFLNIQCSGAAKMDSTVIIRPTRTLWMKKHHFFVRIHNFVIWTNIVPKLKF